MPATVIGMCRTPASRMSAPTVAMLVVRFRSTFAVTMSVASRPVEIVAVGDDPDEVMFREEARFPPPGLLISTTSTSLS